MSPTAIPGNLILQSPTASKLILVNDQRNPAGDAQITYGITSTGGVFNLRSSGTVDYEVEWGDGTVERSTSNILAHTYAAGSYVLKIRTAQQYRPLFNNSTDEDQLTSVALVSDLDVGTTLQNAWNGADNMTEFNAASGVTTGVVNFIATWQGCNNLTTFPLINTSSGSNFSNAWLYCSSLTSFPLIDTSIGNNFNSAWRDCSGLTSFPLIDTSSGTNFNSAWRGCSGLTTFPSINTSIGTNFINAWRDCTGLTSFPANFFDSWTGTPVNNCFAFSWDNCSSLTATSVENILNSIDTSGQSAPGVGPDITIDYNAFSGTPNISTAVSNLKSRNWTITLNGVPQ
jgi:hypothetical protein